MAEKELTGQAAKTVWDWIIGEGIEPHVNIIRPIVAGGDVAVVVFNVLPELQDSARALGWDGQAPAFRLSSGMRRRFADGLEGMGDVLAATWLRANRKGRIFVMVESATFLVNFDPVSKTYAIEPGSNDPSTDREKERR